GCFDCALLRAAKRCSAQDDNGWLSDSPNSSCALDSVTRPLHRKGTRHQSAAGLPLLAPHLKRLCCLPGICGVWCRESGPNPLPGPAPTPARVAPECILSPSQFPEYDPPGPNSSGSFRLENAAKSGGNRRPGDLQMS